MSDPDSPRRSLPWSAVFAGMLIAIALGYLTRPDSGREAASNAHARETTGPAVAPAPAASPAAPASPQAPSEPHAIAPTQTLVLERSAFPSSGPVRVSLELPETSADAEPRPVRLVSQPDHRILELSGSLESDRSAATIEIDSNYLEPGTYLVEMKTTERSHFPLRRYFIHVR